MTRRFLIAAAAIALFVAADQRAVAQVIIIQNDPLKQRDEYFTRIADEWFQLYLGRKPSDKEQAQTLQKMRVGTNPIAIQATMLASDEYYKNHGNSTQGFIQGMFNDLIGRKATPAEVAMLQAQINGFGRYRFAVEFLTKTQLPAVRPIVPIIP